WQPVLDAMESGKFFVSTGEVLLPTFSVDGSGAGETLKIKNRGKSEVVLEVDWTFPLNFVEIISGDGEQVFREKIDMRQTKAFGKEIFKFSIDLTGRKWVRVEVWDA